MRERLSPEFRSTASDRSIGGALTFVGLLVAGMVAVSYPVVAVGVGLGLLLGAGFPRVTAAVRRVTRPTPDTDHGRPRLSS